MLPVPSSSSDSDLTDRLPAIVPPVSGSFAARCPVNPVTWLSVIDPLMVDGVAVCKAVIAALAAVTAVCRLAIKVAVAIALLSIANPAAPVGRGVADTIPVLLTTPKLI